MGAKRYSFDRTVSPQRSHIHPPISAKQYQSRVHVPFRRYICVSNLIGSNTPVNVKLLVILF